MNTYEERKEQLLKNQIIVLSDEYRIIAWNKSATFNVYDHDLNNVDCFTCYDINDTLEAQQVAMRHTLED